MQSRFESIRVFNLCKQSAIYFRGKKLENNSEVFALDHLLSRSLFLVRARLTGLTILTIHVPVLLRKLTPVWLSVGWRFLPALSRSPMHDVPKG